MEMGLTWAHSMAMPELLQKPKFVQHPQRQDYLATEPQLHVALVKIRASQTLNDATIHSVGRTLSQLGRLGLTSVVVVDCNEGAQSNSDLHSRSLAIEQADRVAAAIDANGEPDSRVVNNIIAISETIADDSSAAYLRGKVYVTLRKA